MPANIKIKEEAITRFVKPEHKERCIKWKNTDGYKCEGVQEVHARRFETSNFTSSSVGDGQNKII